ncbi:MAG: DUF6266 family protein [Bacteroidales bacterium]
MAYSTNSLLNKVSGNVQDCTFYLMNGLQVARSKAQKIHNPRTLDQQSNRANIMPLLNFFRQLKPLLYLSLNDRAENQTAYNKFMAVNLNKSVKNGSFEPEHFRMSTKSFDSTNFQITRQIDNQDNFNLSWYDDTNEEKLGSDKLLCAYYDFHSNSFQYLITRKSRYALSASVSFNLRTKKSHILIYLFFVRSDYSKSSRMEIIEFR